MFKLAGMLADGVTAARMLSDLLPGSLQDWSPTTDGSLVSQSTCVHSPDCDYVLLLNGSENLRQLLAPKVSSTSFIPD